MHPFQDRGVASRFKLGGDKGGFLTLFYPFFKPFFCVGRNWQSPPPVATSLKDSIIIA